MAHRLESEVNQLIEKLMLDYDKGRDIDVVENYMHPDKDVLKVIIGQIQNIIFPGYYENKNYRIYTVRNNLTTLLEDVLYNLSKQIFVVLRFLPEYEGKEEAELRLEGERISIKFLDRLPYVREMIQTDLEAAYDGDPAAFNKP